MRALFVSAASVVLACCGDSPRDLGYRALVTEPAPNPGFDFADGTPGSKASCSLQVNQAPPGTTGRVVPAPHFELSMERHYQDGGKALVAYLTIDTPQSCLPDTGGTATCQTGVSLDFHRNFVDLGGNAAQTDAESVDYTTTPHVVAGVPSTPTSCSVTTTRWSSGVGNPDRIELDAACVELTEWLGATAGSDVHTAAISVKATCTLGPDQLLGLPAQPGAAD